MHQLIEHRGVERPLEMQSCIRTVDPGHFCAQRLERRKADNDSLAGIDHLDEFDPAATGGNVKRAKLETKSAELLHSEFRNYWNPAALPSRILRRHLRSRQARVSRRYARSRLLNRGCKPLGIRAQLDAAHPVLGDVPLQTHWLTARLTPISAAPLPSSRTSRLEPRSETTTK